MNLSSVPVYNPTAPFPAPSACLVKVVGVLPELILPNRPCGLRRVLTVRRTDHRLEGDGGGFFVSKRPASFGVVEVGIISGEIKSDKDILICYGIPDRASGRAYESCGVRLGTFGQIY
jgi:hypothetical protein